MLECVLVKILLLCEIELDFACEVESVWTEPSPGSLSHRAALRPSLLRMRQGGGSAERARVHSQ